MTLFNPSISRHLIADEGEVVIDEVRKHWAAVVVPWIEVAAGVALLLASNTVPAEVAWVPALLGAAVSLHGGWRVLGQYRDRFVITNMRVFRVHGILSQQIATMPLARILDISVYKPVVGRILGYGHFVFESAAQEQGLREIRFVGDPDGRGLTIQRVIAQSGLRGSATRNPDAPLGSPPSPQPPRPSTPPHVEADHRELAWLAGALRREHERLAELRGERSEQPTPRNPDRTDTAPIQIPR